MGCCSSKLPTFPPASVAEGILPLSPPTEFDAQGVKFVPQPGMFGGSVAVYLPNDFDTPSYFFSPAGGCYKMFRLYMGNKEEVSEIEVGSSSQNTEVFGEEIDQYEKTLTVITNVNGLQEKVEVNKTFTMGSSSSHCQIDNGYSVLEDTTNGSVAMSLHGDPIALFYENPEVLKELAGIGMGGATKHAKAPAAVYMKRSLSENDMIRALSIIAAVNDRLLRISGMDATDTEDDHYYDSYGHNNYGYNNGYNNNYNNNNGGDDYGGGDDNYGGGDDDYGGGDDDYGGGDE